MTVRHAWCDGELLPVEDVAVCALDRTLLYGLGAFEAVRLYGGRPFLLGRHLARLRASLDALDLPAPSWVDAMPEALTDLARRDGVSDALSRITVTAGPDPRLGLSPGPRVLVHLRAPPPPAESRRPIEVGDAGCSLDARSPLTGIKSTSYLLHYRLRERAEAEGRYEDLLFDVESRVLEGTVSSVFVVAGGVLATPPLGAGILPGVTRGLVMELADELELPCEERAIPRGELATAEECFLTGAGKVFVDVDRLLGRSMPPERPVARSLAAAVRDAIARHCAVPRADVRF